MRNEEQPFHLLRLVFCCSTLGGMTMQNQASVAANVRATPVSTTISKPLQLATAFLLGMVMLYGAGFVQTSVAHNAAHDARHSLAFPCH